MGIISRFFANKDEMSEKDYTISKLGFIADGAFATGAAHFIAAPYLAGLLAELGASEAANNFILSLGLPAGLIQILIPLFIGRITFKKPFIYYCRFFDKMPQILAFFVPFIFGKSNLSVIIMGILILFAHLHAYLMTPFYNALFMKCASTDNSIGKFCGIKDSVANITAGVSTFAAGLITTYFIEDGDIYGYGHLAGIALILWALGMISLFFVKEPYTPAANTEKSESLKKIFTQMLKDKKFRPYLKFALIYSIGANLVGTLTNVMSVQRMHISLNYMSYCTMICLIIMTILAPLFGKLSDKFGCKKILVFSLIFIALTHLSHAFMTPENAIILKIIATILSGIGSAAYNAPSFAFLYQSLPDTNRTSYMSCISVLNMAVSYIASLTATAVVGIADGFYITLFGIRFYEMHLIFIVGAIVVIMSSLTLTSKKAK